MVTSGTLGQFQLVFQAKDVGDVLDGALDQVGINSSFSIYSNEQTSLKSYLEPPLTAT